jgi:hypothetical protein
MSERADRSRARSPKGAFPFELIVEGPGFRVSDRYATEDEVYFEARRIRDERARSETVVVRTKFGYAGRYAVGTIKIQRWNPVTQRWANHAEPWSRTRPKPNALTPIPRDWYDEPLPADWYADPAEA